jgi:hypothetical protein
MKIMVELSEIPEDMPKHYGPVEIDLGIME